RDREPGPAQRLPGGRPAGHFRPAFAIRHHRATSFVDFTATYDHSIRWRANRPVRGAGLPRLGDPDVVAERIAQTAVDAVGLFGRLLGELHPLGAQFLVGLAAVVGGEDEAEAHGPLGEQVANLCGVLLRHRRRAGALQQDLPVRLPRDGDRQPAHEPEVDVRADLHTQLADVEVERLVLIEYEDRGVRNGVEHAAQATAGWEARASPKLLGRVHAITKQVGTGVGTARRR